MSNLPIEMRLHQPDPSGIKNTSSTYQMRVFVSYARKDAAFVDRLHDSLEEDPRLNVLRDTQDIMASEAWWNRIKNLVRSSDAVIFVLSSNWLESRISTMELEHAAGLNKQIIPVILNETPLDDIPKALKKLNFIKFVDDINFSENMQELAKTLLIDIAWVREHTRLATLAHRWRNNEESEHLLLRSIDIPSAEQWLNGRLPDAPEPTRDHIAYIHKSRRAKRKRVAMRVFGVLALSVGIAGTYFIFENLIHENKIENWKRLARLADGQSSLNKPVTGALLALETFGERSKKDIKYSVPQAEIALDRALRDMREKKVIGMQEGSINDASFSPDGRFFVTAGDDGEVRFWSGDDAKPIGSGIAHQTLLTRARISSDSQFLATATVSSGKKNGGVYVYDVSDPSEPKAVFSQSDLGIVRHIMFARDKPLLVALVKTRQSKNFQLIVWDYLRKNTIFERKDVSSRSNGFAIAPTGRSLALTTFENDVQLVSLKGGDFLSLPRHRSRVLAVTMSDDEKWIATSTRNARVRIWRRDTGAMAFDLGGHQGRVTALSFSPDSSILLSACYDGLVRVWQVETGELRAELEHTDPVQRISISPRGRRLLSISSDRVAYLWDIKRTKLVARLKGHNKRPFIAAWHPDGQAAVTASADKTARYWDLVESPGGIILTRAHRMGQ